MVTIVPAKTHIPKNSGCICEEASCKARVKLQQLKDETSFLESQIKSLKKYLKSHKSKKYRFALWFLEKKSSKCTAKIEKQRSF